MRIMFFASFVMVLITTHSVAQPISVKQQSEKVKGDNVEGYSSTLDAKRNDVNSSWTKFLKEVGKLKLLSSDPVVVTEPNFNSTVYQKGIIYANIFDNGDQTRVWIGLNPKEWEEKDRDVATKETEKLVYQFVVRFNREKVQKQIDETQHAADAVEKQRQRLVSQNKDMTFQLTNNQKEKVHLEKSIENNRLEYEALLIKLDKNKKAQDSLSNVSAQIKKVKEGHEERLRKIN
jgi:flagellin-like hook-associated protein FlgL